LFNVYWGILIAGFIIMKASVSKKVFRSGVAVISAVIGLGIGWGTGSLLSSARTTPQIPEVMPPPAVEELAAPENSQAQKPEGQGKKRDNESSVAKKGPDVKEESEPTETRTESIEEQIKRKAVEEVFKKIDEAKSSLEKEAQTAAEDRKKENPWNKLKRKKPTPPDGDH
jgi:hypothetical protein